MTDIVCPEDHVDVRQLGQQPLTVALTDAPAHRNKRAGVSRGLQYLKGRDLTKQPVISVLTHCARHEHDHVGLLRRIDRAHALRGE